MIFQQLEQQLHLLGNLLSSINNEQYTRKIAHLADTSIGGHTRHIIEMVQCVTKGYNKSEIDYLNRSRNLTLEHDRLLALFTAQQLENGIRVPDREVKIVVETNDESDTVSHVPSTYFREIVYATDHTIHHLALIKVALIEMKLEIANKYFGVAYSTLKYRASLEAE